MRVDYEQSYFLNCESLLYNGHYKEAFNCFTNLLQTEGLSDKEVSSIHNYLGTLITIEPSLSNEEDESGLGFYLQAIHFNRKNTGAWLNIAGSFGCIPNLPLDQAANRKGCIAHCHWSLL